VCSCGTTRREDVPLANVLSVARNRPASTQRLVPSTERGTQAHDVVGANSLVSSSVHFGDVQTKRKSTKYQNQRATLTRVQNIQVHHPKKLHCLFSKV
jgi:hypothetical protein